MACLCEAEQSNFLSAPLNYMSDFLLVHLMPLVCNRIFKDCHYIQQSVAFPGQLSWKISVAV